MRSDANRLAALGENVLLLVTLPLLAIAYFGFVGVRLRYQSIVETQMRYLPAYTSDR